MWGNEAHVYKGIFRLPWLPERYVCNELRLILWSVQLDDQSARASRTART